ncbi:cupin-like domain-containing protein [Lysobacter brunescens]|uniref:Cupin-like domain-containing protein n=1 Tax=Lysobacter brunescens TaxID=262323 RepID=A0ABW2Y7Z7_9GAMM
MPESIVEVAEVAGLDPHALPDAILASQRPLLLKGLVSDWPLVHAAAEGPCAAIAHLRGFDTGQVVTAMVGPPEIEGRFFYNDALDGFNFVPQRQRIATVLDALATHLDDPAPPALYVGSTAIDACLPGLLAPDALAMGDRDPLVSLWLGNRSRIPAHQDLPDNLACVVAGRRRFTLFPPEQLPNLYIGPLDFTPAGQPVSLVDISAPDLTRFPRYAEAQRHAQVAELAPGDALLIPSMWWHHVEGLEPFNMLVNYWWRRSPGYMDTPMTALMAAILCMRDLPAHERAIWRDVFRHYVFEHDDDVASHVPEAARRILGPLDADAARRLRAMLLNRFNR